MGSIIVEMLIKSSENRNFKNAVDYIFKKSPVPYPHCIANYCIIHHDGQLSNCNITIDRFCYLLRIAILRMRWSQAYKKIICLKRVGVSIYCTFLQFRSVPFVIASVILFVS